MESLENIEEIISVLIPSLKSLLNLKDIRKGEYLLSTKIFVN